MGLFGLLDSVAEVLEAGCEIVTAPVEIAVDLVKVPVKEIAGAAADLVADVKSLSK